MEQMDDFLIVPALPYPQEVRELFSEYTQLLLEGAPAFRRYLDIQDYDQELAHLEKKYGPPHGRLYLARCGARAAGCVGLRRIDGEDCELKRLYVRPEFRGHRLGERLMDQVIRDAGEIGYRHMLLDTLPFLTSAIRMYRARGFYEIPRYNDSPLDDTIFMQLDL